MPTVKTAKPAPRRTAAPAQKLAALRTPAPARPEPRQVGPALAGLVLLLGAAAAGAAWIGGSLYDLRENMSASLDAAAARGGLRLLTVQLEGVSGARAEEARAVLLPQGRISLLAADPIKVRTRLEALSWVASARVSRMWPSTLVVQISRKRAFAVVQRDGAAVVIDERGRPAEGASAEELRALPLLRGAGATAAAADILGALENAPEVRRRLHALIRIGERRWDMELLNGVRVSLPEKQPERALARLEGLHRLHALLDQPVERLDMRHAGELLVLPGPRRQPAAAKESARPALAPALAQRA